MYQESTLVLTVEKKGRMKKSPATLVLLTITFAVGVIYGIVLHKTRMFPYTIAALTYHRIRGLDRTHGPWSIAIYEGATPFDLADPVDVSNPVLTGKDVLDIDAAFVADPFMVRKDGRYFMFFEVLNRETGQGDIAYAESVDGKEWDYREVIIDEPFHLSYPCVFEWEDSYYLIPESRADFSVRLYRATEFPEAWEYVGNLLSGYEYVDPSIFHYQDEWWMFISTEDSSVLNLYFSEELSTGWRPHPMNPIVKLDRHFSRPGGRVIAYDDRLYRFTQDDDPRYGLQVFAFEITELSEISYADRLASEEPVVAKTGVGWNAAGMHHVDLHEVGDRWIAAVDGRDR